MDHDSIEQAIRDAARRRFEALGEIPTLGVEARGRLLDEARRLHGPGGRRMDATSSAAGHGPWPLVWARPLSLAAAVMLALFVGALFLTKPARESGSGHLATAEEPSREERADFGEMKTALQESAPPAVGAEPPHPAEVVTGTRFRRETEAPKDSPDLAAADETAGVDRQTPSAPAAMPAADGRAGSSLARSGLDFLSPPPAVVTAPARYPDTADGRSQAGGGLGFAAGRAVLKEPPAGAISNVGGSGMGERFRNSLASGDGPLERFELRRSGNALTIIDADGSIYTGAVAEGGGFEVKGSNRSTGKNLIFNGTLAAGSEVERKAVATYQAGFAGANDSQEFGGTVQASEKEPPPYITGVAKVGDREFRVDAVPDR